MGPTTPITPMPRGTETPLSMLVHSILKKLLQLKECHCWLPLKNSLSPNWGSAGLAPVAAIYTVAASVVMISVIALRALA